MRWFKHLTNASEDPMIAEIEELFGLEGYARWMKLLEAVGQHMGKGNEGCSVAYPWSKWQTILKGKRNKLSSFLEHLQNKRRINLKQNGEILEIEVPELASLRDEYTKKSGQTPDKLRSKETDTELPTEVTETETPPTPADGGEVLAKVKPKPSWPKHYRFEDWYSAYPAKVAPAAAKTAWEKLTKRLDFGDEFVDRLIAAVEKAKQFSPKWRNGYIPNPSTWLNQQRWEDELPAASGAATSGASASQSLKPWEQYEEGTPEYIEARRKAIRFATL